MSIRAAGFEERASSTGQFSRNLLGCANMAGGAALQHADASVVDKISSRLAATPLFVETFAGPPRSCVSEPNPQAAFARETLMPANFCAPAGLLAVTSERSLGISPICWPLTGGVYAQRWDVLRASPVPPLKIARADRREDKFQWRPALLQSVEFLLFEHAFRLADDPYLRYLLFHKPFWHDWLVSAGQFDMSRWGDGDNFLVNYIGHPMQGGVTGNIYIQNDPRARALKFGRSKEYWQSRMKAMAWSAVYSAYFEIGPGLSEVAVGNEGGYTYTPGCGHYVCDRPGYKPPTNNTGWVDFIVTPTMGTGLMILEDAIERQIVDRIVKDDPRFRYKALRATLAPTHSMANMLAGRMPWFRFAEDSFQPASTYEPKLQRRSQPWLYEHRWDAGVHYTNIDLPMDWQECPACRVHSSGIGTSLGYRLTNLLYFDSEFNVFPGSGAANAKGRAEEFLAGVKVGRTFGSWGVFTTLRPGFIHYGKTLAPGSQSEYESANRFAFDAGGVVEYHASSRSAIRFDLGATFVRYLTGHPDPRQLPDTVLSGDYIATQGSFHLGSGYIFRF
ncbi:MAG: hypothetical protein M3P45_09570 [Acidobacteriota bacterium]|nr:hypothetical protein [Acidobacteriota bacterium]